MIVPIELEDLPRIMEIERASHPTPWSRRLFHEEFTNALGIRYGYRDERLEGYIFGWMIFEDLHINNIAVDPAIRRRGTGSALLSALLGEAKKRDARKVILEVRPSNTAARALYQKHGFTEVMIRAGYYSDTGEDALVLAAEI